MDLQCGTICLASITSGLKIVLLLRTESEINENELSLYSGWNHSLDIFIFLSYVHGGIFKFIMKLMYS